MQSPEFHYNAATDSCGAVDISAMNTMNAMDVAGGKLVSSEFLKLA